LQFVFVEGAAATGKSSLCQELHQRGYTVQFENFVELCAKVSTLCGLAAHAHCFHPVRTNDMSQEAL
jgi:predicted ATPase